MLDTALKALELLLNKLKEGSTPDKKREKLAKQLLQIYLDVDELVFRGREILALYKERPSTSGKAVTLLTAIAHIAEPQGSRRPRACRKHYDTASARSFETIWIRCR